VESLSGNQPENLFWTRVNVVCKYLYIYIATLATAAMWNAAITYHPKASLDGGSLKMLYKEPLG
jgi:hypothetical protein